MVQSLPAEPGTLFCFGLGYSALRLAERLRPLGWKIGGTCRGDSRLAGLMAIGIDAHLFDDGHSLPPSALEGVTHLLTSIPTIEGVGDPVLAACRKTLEQLPTLRWVGYLSTTGVYGDHQGGWVDESTPPAPYSPRLERRVQAERDWLALRHPSAAVQVFRLSGIYGPGRSVFDDLLHGTARRIDKPGHYFSRIHVNDIAAVLLASIAHPASGEIYNVCDDAPSPSREVVEYACELLGIEPPPLVAFADAPLSPMAQEFYRANRRVANRKLREKLGVRLQYPTYREGLAALLPEYTSFFNTRSRE